MNAKLLEKEKEDLREEYRRERADLDARLKKLRHQAQDYESLQARYQKLKDDVEIQIVEGIDIGIKNLGFGPAQVETLWADRKDLVEMYLKKLYSLAKQFAMLNKETRKNRGLFLLLVDQRNMVSDISRNSTMVRRNTWRRKNTRRLMGYLIFFHPTSMKFLISWGKELR
jgi:chromosome segregation ATPase